MARVEYSVTCPWPPHPALLTNSSILASPLGLCLVVLRDSSLLLCCFIYY